MIGLHAQKRNTILDPTFNTIGGTYMTIYEYEKNIGFFHLIMKQGIYMSTDFEDIGDGLTI